MNSTPTEESDESVDDTDDELSQSQIHEDNLPLETFTGNSAKENVDLVELNIMRMEMQKMPAEISDRIQRATKTELADTIQLLKSIRDLMNKKILTR